MHRRRSAMLVALSVLVALVATACGNATLSASSGMSSSAMVAGNPNAGAPNRGGPNASDPDTGDPNSGVPDAGGAGDQPDTGDDRPSWQLSPDWALHPELLRGSERFQQLTRKGAPTPGRRPNVVLISTDDMNASDLRWMPKTRALLGADGAGVTFTDAISPHPLCCPARAITLTGQYAQNNGVHSNVWPSGGYYRLDSTNTLPVWLKNAGYQTAFVGKYLNEYGLLDPTQVPPGWDHWRAPVKSGIYDYYHYTMNEDGELHHYDGVYSTDYLADETGQLVADMAAKDRPFFLWQSNLAPHTACPTTNTGRGCWDAPTPSTEYDGAFDHVPQPQRRKPSYNERDVSDKPEFFARRPPLSAGELSHIRELFQRRIESLQSVDDSVARTVSDLKAAGELDDTLIIFTTDHGYLLGEHRYVGKIVGYEPALQVPMVMRGPGVPAGVRRPATVSMLDLAPTIAAVAGATPELTVDGRNMLPVAQGRAPGWDTLLIQGGPRSAEADFAWLYRGVRTDRYTYMRRHTGEVELYDRARDPYELRNVAGDPAYAATEAELARRLQRLEECAGAACRQRFGPVPRPHVPAGHR